MKPNLIQKIENKQAVVSVVGLGYVGLPLAVELAKAGYLVQGIDRNKLRVEMVNRGESYIGDVDTFELTRLVGSGQFRVSGGFDEISDADVIVIAVPTPLNQHLDPDLQYIRSVACSLVPYLRPGQLIALESTTYPGTTEEVLLPILVETGMVAEVDFYLAYSPERIDPGNASFSERITNKVVGAVGPNSLEAAVCFYGAITKSYLSQAPELPKW